MSFCRRRQQTRYKNTTTQVSAQHVFRWVQRERMCEDVTTEQSDATKKWKEENFTTLRQEGISPNHILFYTACSRQEYGAIIPSSHLHHTRQWDLCLKGAYICLLSSLFHTLLSFIRDYDYFQVSLFLAVSVRKAMSYMHMMSDAYDRERERETEQLAKKQPRGSFSLSIQQSWQQKCKNKNCSKHLWCRKFFLLGWS